MLAYSRPYGVGAAFERAISRARDAAEAKERGAVAAEICRLVHESGLSRSEFASRIGTSAALLLRMQRVARTEERNTGR